MLLRLLLLLTIVPLADLFVMLKAHRAIVERWGADAGLMITLGTIVLTGFLGAVLARRQGLQALRALRQALERGEFPGRALVDGVLILLGGALLIAPGYLTDLLGISLLIPWTRRLYRLALLAWIRRKLARGQALLSAAKNITIGPTSFDERRDVVIDVTPKDGPPPR